jgi:hypothetical protein
MIINTLLRAWLDFLTQDWGSKMGPAILECRYYLPRWVWRSCSGPLDVIDKEIQKRRRLMIGTGKTYLCHLPQLSGVIEFTIAE